MGVVYRGQHLQLPREVAIKSINPRQNPDLRRLRSRFEKEAFIQSQLDHPGIVKVYDYIVSEKSYFIVMEYVEGRSLAQFLEKQSGRLPVERALDLFEQMLAAIAYAQHLTYQDQDGTRHQGLIHRDLKPANILITPDDHLKITDFGIVKLAGTRDTDTLGGAYGSPEYVSPEQAQNSHTDARSDIYSLGIILYEMLTGEPPFCCKDDAQADMEIVRRHIYETPRPPSQVNPAIAPELEAIIMRALEKKPDQRYSNALEFLRAVRHARGRETEDLRLTMKTAAPARNHVGTFDLDETILAQAAPQGRVTQRESYVTQPLKMLVCESCGASVSPSQQNCGKCGHTLNLSSATTKLTQQEAAEWQRKRSRNLWLLLSLGAVGLIGGAVLYANHTPAPPAQATINAPAPSPTSSTTPTSPPAAYHELKISAVKVDSSFDGYNATPLTDGEIDVRRIAAMHYNKGNWASAETQEPHWIELEFQNPVRLATVYIYWGYDRNRFVPSHRVELQAADERGAWQTVSVMQPSNDYDHMAFEFAPLTTTRARIVQPALQGPTGRPFVMWVREVKAFGELNH
jgi:serine/threonine protein kinase